MNDVKMYQVSTLQALAMGHTRSVVEVQELMKHGNTGLGTFAGVNGEMIVVDGQCYRANEDGTVEEARPDMGVPFASVCTLSGARSFELGEFSNVDELKKELNNKIEEDFGLNCMHMVRIDGIFKKIDARSESAYNAIHVSLKDILSANQRAFVFDEVKGTLICVYYPDFMDGINLSGWHLHFISDDRTQGGHVFDLEMEHGDVRLDKISNIELQLPTEPVFDTYSLKNASEDDIKKVEQGDNK